MPPNPATTARSSSYGRARRHVHYILENGDGYRLRLYAFALRLALVLRCTLKEWWWLPLTVALLDFLLFAGAANQDLDCLSGLCFLHFCAGSGTRQLNAPRIGFQAPAVIRPSPNSWNRSNRYALSTSLNLNLPY